jgi:hypothetical protein
MRNLGTRSMFQSLRRPYFSHGFSPSLKLPYFLKSYGGEATRLELGVPMPNEVAGSARGDAACRLLRVGGVERFTVSMFTEAASLLEQSGVS